MAPPLPRSTSTDNPADLPALAARFQERFGGRPRIFRSPGRVNLIGEHTDYNDGFVMPAAIPFDTHVAVARAGGRRITAHSENMEQTTSVDLDESEVPTRRDWSDYVRGVAVLLDRECGPLMGANLLLKGSVPLGAGLSSSASLEVAVAFALLANSGRTLDRTAVARLCQRAENEFAGARCGIMDQFTACHARTNSAIVLDCRSLEFRYAGVPASVRLVVANTMVKHALASGEYNRRREECEEGVRVLSQSIPGIRALRDVNPAQLDEFSSTLGPVILRRCRHVVTENARVLAAAGALEREDLASFGGLMLASHRSLRDDYEVSCAELDTMVDLAAAMPGVYGARMTGAGFGGCTVSLVAAGQAETVAAGLFERYWKQTGIRCEIYICGAADGASEETA